MLKAGGYPMFEYHEPNLKVDAAGVSVTVRLAEPLDIEKPLADLDLTTTRPIYAEQEVVTTWDIAELEQDLDGNQDRAEIDEEDDWGRDEFRWMRGHPIKGFNPKGWEPREYDHDEHPEHYEVDGDGNETVLERAVPYLELGVKGLLAWCAKEGQELAEFKQWAEIRSQEVIIEKEKLRQEAEQAFKEQQEREAAELERVMPKRAPLIAFQELNKFIEEHGLERHAHRPSFWKEIDGKRLELYNGDGFSGNTSIRLYQDPPPKHYNWRIGKVEVSERGYFAAGKMITLDLVYDNDARDCRDFPTVEEALESLIPYVLEGEEDSVDLLTSTVRGTEDDSIN
jgi:hypothetical protein